MLKPLISSQRLTLRKPLIEDAEELFNAYTSDSLVTRYLTWVPHRDLIETQRFLKYCIEKWKEGNEFNYIIETNMTKDLIGMFKITVSEDKANIGYVIARSEWNKGYITEIIGSVLAYLFRETQVNMVQAFCDVENMASEKVMMKSGMKFVKVLPSFISHPNISDQMRDCLLYEIEKSEFKNK